MDKQAILDLLEEHFVDTIFTSYEAVALLWTPNNMQDYRDIQGTVIDEAKNYGRLRLVGDNPSRGFLFQFTKYIKKYDTNHS